MTEGELLIVAGLILFLIGTFLWIWNRKHPKI